MDDESMEGIQEMLRHLEDEEEEEELNMMSAKAAGGAGILQPPQSSAPTATAAAPNGAKFPNEEQGAFPDPNFIPEDPWDLCHCSSRLHRICSLFLYLSCLLISTFCILSLNKYRRR